MKDLLDTNIDELEDIEMGMSYTDADLDEPYKPVSQLHIPQEAVDHYARQGFDLHWVRIYQPNSHGTLDGKNIQQKENDRYQFIPRSEIPGLGKAMTSYFGNKLDTSSHGLYVVGDLALAKIPTVFKEKKKDFLAQRTRDRSEAVIHDLRKNNLLPNKERGEGWKIEHERKNEAKKKPTRETTFG